MTLREITAETVVAICNLRVKRHQRRYVPGEASPRDFYAKFGFDETGEEDDGELVMRLPLG